MTLTLSLRQADALYRAANKIANPCDFKTLESLYRSARSEGMRIQEANIYAILKAYEA